MTILVVQTVTQSASWSASFGSAVSSASTLFAVAGGYNGSNVTNSSSNPLFDSTAGTGGQAPVKLFSEIYPYDGTATDYAAAWMLPPPSAGWPSSAGPLAVTMTNSQALAAVGLIGYEVSGLSTSPTIDKNPAPAEGLSTAPSSGASGNITQAPELVLGVIVQDQTVAALPGAPWTSTAVHSGNNTFAGYQIPASSGSSYTYSATASPSARWAAGIVTLYAGGQRHRHPVAGRGAAETVRDRGRADDRHPVAGRGAAETVRHRGRADDRHPVPGRGAAETARDRDGQPRHRRDRRGGRAACG